MPARHRSTAEAQLAAEVREAFSAGEPLEIRGGGTRGGIGKPVRAARMVSSGALNGVSLYEPGALTIVVGAGTPVADIEAALAAERQRLPFEPPDHRGLFGSDGVPTIGAIAAGNLSGPRRIQAGACRDAMLGVRFIDGRGDVIANGGRVMKNVTGYDLVKLLAGSWGTLGVLTEIAFKVQPLPEATATLMLEGLDDTRAIAALSAALGSPYDVNGTAHIGGRTLVRVDGFAAQIAHRVPALRRVLADFGSAEVIEGDEGAALWRTVRDIEPFHGRAGAVWRVSVRPTDGPAIAAALPDAEVIYDWGGGLVWMLVPEGRDAGADVLRQAAASCGGHATLFRASDDMRARIAVFQPEAPPVAALSARLRRQFDPAGILNPGRMG